MIDALVKRHSGTGDEHQQRDDEAPEVELPTVAKGVIEVGGPGGSLQSVQQQELVDRVDERMNPFAQHRGAASKRRRHELGRRDRQIADERGVD